MTPQGARRAGGQRHRDGDRDRTTHRKELPERATIVGTAPGMSTYSAIRSLTIRSDLHATS